MPWLVNDDGRAACCLVTAGVVPDCFGVSASTVTGTLVAYRQAPWIDLHNQATYMVVSSGTLQF